MRTYYRRKNNVTDYRSRKYYMPTSVITTVNLNNAIPTVICEVKSKHAENRNSNKFNLKNDKEV